MYRTISDFNRDWKYDSEQTAKLFANLTDASLGQKVSAEGRSLGFLAWHIVLTMGEMLGQVGLKVDAPAEDSPVPSTAAEIVKAFRETSAAVADSIAANWTDDTLLQEDDMYGERWTRGQTLLYLIFHQAHHRGQITVLMRQAGLPVVGIYGPAKEEWAAMGMEALP